MSNPNALQPGLFEDDANVTHTPPPVATTVAAEACERGLTRLPVCGAPKARCVLLATMSTKNRIVHNL